MLGGVGDTLPDLGSELLDRPLALRQHVDDLRAATVAERLRDRSERGEQRILGVPVAITNSTSIIPQFIA